MTPSIGETVYLDFIVSGGTGAAADADSTPTAAVHEDDNDTAILTPTVTKRTSLTGNYRVPVACTSGNGFEAGKSYNVVVSATVGGVAAKCVVGTFQCRTRDADDPVTLADGAHGGAAAVLTLERLIVTSATANEPAVKLTGNGTGPGMLVQAEVGAGFAAGAKFVGGLGSNSHGIHAAAGATAAAGLYAVGGHGIHGVASGSGKAGMYLVGGASAGALQLVGAASAPGLRVTGGSGGNAAEFNGGTNGSAAVFTANGTGHGAVFTAGASGDDVYLTGSDAPTLLAAVWTGGTRVLSAGDNIVLAKGTGVTGFTDISAADVRTAVGLASANLDTQLDALPTAAEAADALLGRNVAGGSSTGRTVSQALYAIRNKVSISGSTMTVYMTDDVTSSWTATLTSDAAAEPITAVDPG